jgi:ABC-type branched-subunit amino acid transport system ATPase component/ABC-type branched-subunit amino acid transport system permease subunit
VATALLFIGTLLLIYAVAAFPLNLLQGYAGMLSMSLAANFAVGAYTFAILSTAVGLDTLTALLGAAVAGVLVQAVLSTFTARLSEIYFVLATLALHLILLAAIDNWVDLTGGPSGIFGLPAPVIGGIDVVDQASFLVFCLVCFAISATATWYVAHSSLGLRLRAMRDDSVALAAVGSDTRLLRVFVNAYYAAWFGVAGGLYASFLNTVTPLSFTIFLAVTFQAIIIVGGSGNFWGPLVGLLVLLGIPEMLRYLPGLGIPESALAAGRDIAYGIILILVVRFRPEGVLRMRVKDAGRPRHGDAREATRPTGASDVTAAPAAPVARRETTIAGDDTLALQVADVRVHFSGVAALQGARLDVPRGQVTGVIGPNGAGKSTLFNVVSGFVRPDAGRVLLDGTDITDLAVHRRAQLGLGRMFQDLRLFGSLSPRQNLELADRSARRHHAGHDPDTVDRWLEYFGLDALPAAPVSGLDYGTQKLVALARTLCSGAHTLLLDEPGSGLDPHQVDDLTTSIRRLVDDLGLTVCIVEHNMDVIRRVSDHVVAMHDGTTIAEGAPHDVLRNHDVIHVYLGE